MASNRNNLFCLLSSGLVIWSGLSWVVLLILAGLKYVCGQLLQRLWAGWSKIASAKTAYLCSMSLLILQQASPSLFTCQAPKQGSRRAEWKLARPLEAWTWNWHNLTSAVFCLPKQVSQGPTQHILQLQEGSLTHVLCSVLSPTCLASPVTSPHLTLPHCEDLPSFLLPSF